METPTNYIQDILNSRGGQERSIRWYQNKIREFGIPSQKKLLNEGQASTTLYRGKMNFFVYNPKHRETLPYYDKFPLILPLQVEQAHFIGLNFHYLSIPYRLQLLEKLQRFRRGTGENEIMKVRWDRVNNFKESNAVVKKYLKNHVRSVFREINPDEMLTAILLPVQSFSKRSIYKVYADSRRMMSI